MRGVEKEMIDLFVRYFPTYFDAFIMTIKLAILSLIFASIVGIVVGLITSTKTKNAFLKILQGICKIYIDLIRGTPMLVQILIIYYGIPQVLRASTGFQWANIGGAFTAGIVILTLSAGAYMAEIVRAGIESVDVGQFEAARSLGLPYSKTMIKVILPQAIRTMLPSIINQFIISIKDTSLLSTIGVRELTNNGKIQASAASDQVMALYCMMALYYLVICLALSKVSKMLERRYSYGR